MRILHPILLLLASTAFSTTNAAPDSFPEVKDLPVQTNLPDVMTMLDGTKVTTPAQWRARREEMKAILEHYELGHAPPPPGNVSGKDIQSRTVLDGAAKFPARASEIRARRKTGIRHRHFHARPRADRFRPSSIHRSS